jgi:hypothetical protein
MILVRGARRDPPPYRPFARPRLHADGSAEGVEPVHHALQP